jgi:hypothetical protein
MMTSFQSAIQADARYIVPPAASIDSSAVAGSFLIVFCCFFLIASVVHRRHQRDAEQLKADRAFLERIWQTNSNLER